MRRIQISIRALLCFSLAACSTPRSEPDTPQTLDIQSASILPEYFTKSGLKDDHTFFRIPEQALGLALIKRPKAELRQGPGLHFELEENLLPQGTRVFIIERSAFWRRVFAPDLKIWGWVHRKTLRMAEQKDALLTVNPRGLPKVFAARPIETAYNFGNLSELKVSIPKGAGFLKVRERGDKVLVILPDTRSLLWLAKKDVP